MLDIGAPWGICHVIDNKPQIPHTTQKSHHTKNNSISHNIRSGLATHLPQQKPYKSVTKHRKHQILLVEWWGVVAEMWYIVDVLHSSKFIPLLQEANQVTRKTRYWVTPITLQQPLQVYL